MVVIGIGTLLFSLRVEILVSMPSEESLWFYTDYATFVAPSGPTDAKHKVTSTAPLSNILDESPYATPCAKFLHSLITGDVLKPQSKL